jgi:hypothetical protein
MLRGRSHGESEPVSVLPRTVVGQFFRALMAGDAPTRRHLSAKLGGGKAGWNYDEPAVIEAACQLAVRRLWGAEYDVRDITAAVTFMREASIERRGKAPYGQLEMEAVIRAALGEADVDTSGIIPPIIFEVEIGVTGYAIRKLGLSEHQIDQLIVEAEDIAIERGWNPPLAD